MQQDKLKKYLNISNTCENCRISQFVGMRFLLGISPVRSALLVLVVVTITENAMLYLCHN